MWYYQTSVTPLWVGRLCLVYIDDIFFGHAQVSVKNEIYHVQWTHDSMEQCNQIPDHFKRLCRVVSMSSLIPATCNFHVPMNYAADDGLAVGPRWVFDVKKECCVFSWSLSDIVNWRLDLRGLWGEKWHTYGLIFHKHKNSVKNKIFCFFL